MTTCPQCGVSYTIGDWPFCPHGYYHPQSPFIPYFDMGLDAHVTSNYQRNKLMKSANADMRDTPSKGALSARIDKASERKKSRA